MKSRFAKGTPEYAEELRLEFGWLLAGLLTGIALRVMVNLVAVNGVPEMTNGTIRMVPPDEAVLSALLA